MGPNTKKIVAALCFLQSGCATVPISTDQAQTVQPSALGERVSGGATLIVKRDAGLTAAGCPVDISLDGNPVGRIKPAQKVTFYASAGDYVLSAHVWNCGPNQAETAITLKPDDVKTYRVFFTADMTLQLQPTMF